MKVGDTPFDAAPDVVLKALTQLSHMGRQAVEKSQETVLQIVQNSNHAIPQTSTLLDVWRQPNEVLVLAYMEDDKINVRPNTHTQAEA